MGPADFAPLGTDRRLALQLVKTTVQEPRSTLHRLSRDNLASWYRFRQTHATCTICGHRGTLLYELPDATILGSMRIGILRETLRCRSCCGKMRDRLMARALLDVVEKVCGVRARSIDDLALVLPDGLRILDTDANGRIARRLAHLPGVVVSLYRPELPSGEDLGDGVVNVDLEQIPFEDGRFDVILTTEVMEHVRFADKAHAEIARALSPGGHYLFTVPYDETLEHTWQLIDPETDEFLVHPPHMHGDLGMRDEGIKSYRVFGRDIVDELGTVGLDTTFRWVDDEASGIFHGDLFVAQKTAEKVALEKA
ncbi:MAG: methyltransferase domain-containing protein [Marmoricola sp.]|nr:methyltransferase domain-containing protein [Marmoricola sp.]